jgi:hypothetical protein
LGKLDIYKLFHNWCWENCRRLKLDPYFLPCKKINLKWNKYLNLRPETLKLLAETIRKILKGLGFGSVFLNRTLITQEIRAKIASN